MIICPTCQKHFEKEEDIAKHFLGCWKRQNPNHISKEAPRSEDITKREMQVVKSHHLKCKVNIVLQVKINTILFINKIFMHK